MGLTLGSCPFASPPFPPNQAINCFGYQCQGRNPTFWTYLPANHTVYVSSIGPLPGASRLWWPYASPDDEVVLVISYSSVSNRRYVWMPAGMGPVTGRLVPEPRPVTVGDGTGHGAYYWDYQTGKLYVKVKGGVNLEIRTEQAVQVGLA